MKRTEIVYLKNHCGHNLIIDMNLGVKSIAEQLDKLSKEYPDKYLEIVCDSDNNYASMNRHGVDFGEWDKGADFLSFIRDLPRVCNVNANVVVFNDWRNLGDIANVAEECGFVIKDILRWEKSNPMPRNRDRRFIIDYELAVWFTMSKAKWVFNRQSNTYDRPLFKGAAPSSNERKHPTQKPLWLMREIITTLSNEGQTVLDCFMGSGSTGVAAISLNRNFVGIELDETYFSIAQDRINKEHGIYDAKEN